jgi:hypothetical protein
MRLTHRYLEHGAAHNLIQVGHRQTAIQYAIAGITKIYEANLTLFGDNPLNSEMEGTMREWVVETLLQGAYLREYHLWEKDCKAYFAIMAERNGETISIETQGLLTGIKNALIRFNVAMPLDILSTIESVRKRVNVMKHDAGLELEHFVTEHHYKEAVNAVERFWEYLADCEQVTP